MHSYLVLATILLVHLLGLAGGASVTTPAVTFSNVVYSGSGAVSFNVNFLQSVTSLNAQHLHLVNTATGATISLSGSTFTSSNGGKVWTVANSAGFYPSNPSAQLTITFSNVPATVCPSPVSLVSVSNPTTVVGTGTPASCTEAAFTAAVASGGIITFNCGSAPVTLTVTSCKNVTLTKDTIIDGGGLVTLSGGGTTRILAIQTYYNYLTPRVTLQNLAFTGGYMTDVANTTATNTGGGALYRLGGAFTIINCDFYGNQGPLTGQDVAGGAVYSVGGNDTTIVGSTFSGNKCSNGGGVGNLGNNFAIYNSIVNGNNATGAGGNPGNGGNGGGICLDGNGVSTYVCGSNVNYNGAGSFGGALFRVGYGSTCPLSLINSTFGWNNAASSAGAVYVQDLPAVITNVAIIFNTAPGAAGLALQYQASYTISQLTVANNTAPTSLGGGIYINSGSGTISDSTIIGNIATAAFAAGISGGSTATTLARCVIAYQQEGNIYVALSCQSTLSDGGGNFQWPQKRLDGNTDNPCTSAVTYEDPLFAPVADNGCIMWTSAPKAGSPATGSGSRCAAGSTSPVPVVLYSSGQVVPRGPFSLTFQQSGAATPSPSPKPTVKPTVAPSKAPTSSPTTAPTTAPTAKPVSTVCVANIGEGATATITCPSASQTITSIQFASYGTPTGSCGSFATSSCNAATSVSYTQSQCLNQNSCSIAVGNGVFNDPCTGTVKHYDAQVACQ